MTARFGGGNRDPHIAAVRRADAIMRAIEKADRAERRKVILWSIAGGLVGFGLIVAWLS
jgi:hypothetical protein